MKWSKSIFIFGINICTMLSQVQYDRIVCIIIVAICCSGAIYEWITESVLFCWILCKLWQGLFQRLVAFPLHFILKLFLEENVNSKYVWHQWPLFYPSPSVLDAQCIATQFLCIKISVLYLHSFIQATTKYYLILVKHLHKISLMSMVGIPLGSLLSLLTSTRLLWYFWEM